MVIHRVTVTERMVINDKASVDLRAWAEVLFRRTLEAIGYRQLDGDERATAEANERDFRKQFEILSATRDVTTRDAAFAAVIASLSLGFHHHGGPGALKEAEADYRRKRTSEVVESNRTPNVVKEIIKQRAQAIWLRSQTFKANMRGTAARIVDDVIADIDSLPQQFKGWETRFLCSPTPTDEKGKRERKEARLNYIDAI